MQAAAVFLALPALALADLLPQRPDPVIRHPYDPLPPSGPCNAALMSSRPVMGAYVAQCDAVGNYETVQCHGSTGYCWCVDSQTGTEVDGTRQAPGGSTVTEAVCRAATAAASKGTGATSSAGGQAGGRCADGFCENPADCPRCAAGLSCTTAPGMMCAGTCYGTCQSPAAPILTPAVDPVYGRPTDRLRSATTCATCVAAGGFWQAPSGCAASCMIADLACYDGDVVDRANRRYGASCPSTAAAGGTGNPACWAGAYTFARCCAGRGDASCWSGQYTHEFCCSNSGH